MLRDKSMTRSLNPWKVASHKPGQPIACTIVRAEPGGYSVFIPKDKLPGFLPTEEKLKPGQEVLARFVCLHENRILLACSFAGPSEKKSATKQQVVWELPVEQAERNAELSGMSEPDAAFTVWTQHPLKQFRHKRATDLILPPFDPGAASTFTMEQQNLEWLITDLEGGMRTGCVRVTSETDLSRAAVLLYRGRSVGCIYGNKSIGNVCPRELCLTNVFKELNLSDTKVAVYSLPEELVLPMSALFLGYPVNRSDDLDPRSYLDYLLGWLAEKRQTACIALHFPHDNTTCLILVHQGQFEGTFHIDQQEFTKEKQYMYTQLEKDADASLEASILPLELLSPSVRYGYSLSMAQKQGAL